MNAPAKSWFERAAARLGLDNWLGFFIVGFLPFAILYFIGLLLATIFHGASPADAIRYTTLAAITVYPVAILTVPFTFFFIRHINSRLESLRDYANQMSKGTSAFQSASQHQLSRVLIAWVLFVAIFTPLFYAFAGLDFITWLLTLPAWYYFMLPPATFLWTFGYAMFSIHKMGSQPLQLKPFTEDKTLGLQPFGRESLRLTGIYLLVVSVILGVILFSSPIPFLFSSSVLLGFSMLGLALFILPLVSLHRQLSAAKKDKLRWIGPRYTALFGQMERVGDSKEDRILLASELSAIDKIQRDIQSIRTWPFDTGIVVRLATITLLPAVLSLVGRLLVLLVLHV